MTNVLESSVWYKIPRYNEIRDQVRRGIPKHTMKIEQAKRRIKTAQSVSATNHENQTIQSNLNRIKRGYSIITRALQHNSDIDRWTEFPGLHDMVKKVAQINWADLRHVPGGPVKHDLPTFDVPSTPNKDQYIKSEQDGDSVGAASSPSFATASINGQGQQAPAQTLYPTPGYVAAASRYHQQGLGSQHDSHAYQDLGYYYQGPPPYLFPLLHDRFHPDRFYLYGPASQQQQQQHSFHYMVVPVPSDLFNFRPYGPPYDPVVPPPPSSPAPPPPPPSPLPSRVQNFESRKTPSSPCPAGAGHKRKRSDSPTELPLHKGQRPVQRDMLSAAHGAQRLEHSHSYRGACLESLALANGLPRYE